jgi:hypothetical protein
MRYLFRSAAFAALAASIGCGAVADKAKEALGDGMTFTGTVMRAGTTTPISGANVRFIQLVDLEAIQQLVEVAKVPKEGGGTRDGARVKLDKVHAFATDLSTTTDDSGKFTMQVPIGAYLVYTFGPGDAPGTSATAYSADFWGINPETGELDLDHLIGKDGKLEQANDNIQLAGGPVNPPADTPVPEAPAAPVPVEDPPTVPPEEPVVADEERPEDTVTPTPAEGVWTKINLAHKDGTLGTDAEGGPKYEADKLELPEGYRYMTLTAELSAPAEGAVYLVMQTGFDSTTTPGCEYVESSAKTNIFPVDANGSTSISYSLVPPSEYYKFFFAKTAKKEEGKAVEVTGASETITVGTRTCDNAVPERPFMATLSWDRESDVDIWVWKYELAKVTAGDTENQLVDMASYQNRGPNTPKTMSLDVDNTYKYGPENNGDGPEETAPEKYCYVVMLNLYSKWGEEPVNSTVDVVHVVNEGGKKKVRQYQWKGALTEYKEWKSVGVYGPTGCEKLASDTPPQGT